MNKKMNKLIKKILFFCFIIASILNCSCSMFGGGEKKWTPLKPGSSGFDHRVIWSDESLEIIAKWYTGKAENSVRLVESNPTIDPDRIIMGSLVFIPKDILMTTEPMPRSHVEDSYKKKTTPKVNSSRKEREKKQTPPSSKEDFQLFGPR